jgi:hypothetical protein
LFIGAMMFWTVAVGLGTWSLMLVSDAAPGTEPAVVLPPPSVIEPKPGFVEGAIPVQVEESQVPEDLVRPID